MSDLFCSYLICVTGFARIGGYAGLEEKFLGQDAWPNISREYVQLVSSGRNVTEYQLRYAKCGMKRSCICVFKEYLVGYLIA